MGGTWTGGGVWGAGCCDVQEQNTSSVSNGSAVMYPAEGFWTVLGSTEPH